jgi:hypothetical protein
MFAPVFPLGAAYRQLTASTERCLKIPGASYSHRTRAVSSCDAQPEGYKGQLPLNDTVRLQFYTAKPDALQSLSNASQDDSNGTGRESPQRSRYMTHRDHPLPLPPRSVSRRNPAPSRIRVSSRAHGTRAWMNVEGHSRGRRNATIRVSGLSPRVSFSSERPSLSTLVSPQPWPISAGPAGEC